MIAIIDYNAGNLKSVEKALHFLGEDCVITRNFHEIETADKVILPGVGALQNDGRLFAGLEENPYVYFVHSYYLKAADEQIVKATTQYSATIHASVESGNTFACQFHPEKSGTVGLSILKNFAKLQGGNA